MWVPLSNGGETKTIPPWPSKVSAPPPIQVSPTPKKGFLYLLDIPVKFQIDWNKASWFIVRASPSLQAYIYQGRIKKNVNTNIGMS